MYKKVTILLLALALFVFFTPPALAVSYDEVEADDVYVRPGERDSKDSSIFRTLTNYVDIEIDNVAGANKVYINDVEAVYDFWDWIFKEYKLEYGENIVNITLEGADGSTHSLTINIHCVDLPLKGLKYIIKDITEENNVQLFGGALALDLGKDNLLLDRRKFNKIAKEQQVEISIYDGSFDLWSYYKPVSPLFKVSALDDDYVLLENGKLTLKYDIENLEAGLETLAVVWFNEKNGMPDRFSFINLGGDVDESSKMITVPFIRDGFGFYGVYSVTHAFGDFYMYDNKINWYNNYATLLYSKGIIDPVNMYIHNLGLLRSDGHEELITQGEFASMLVKAIGLPIDSLKEVKYNKQVMFGDDNPYLKTAQKHGLLNGMPVSFNKLITREEAAVMIARALELHLYDHPDIINRITNRVFSDGEYISDWMRPHVYAVYRARYINFEKDETQRGRFIFKPKDPSTRVQAVEAIYKIMKEKENKAET